MDSFEDLSLIVTIPVKEIVESLGVDEGEIWDSEEGVAEDIIESVCKVMEKFGFKVVDETWEPKVGKYVVEFQDLTQRSMKNLMKQVDYGKIIGRADVDYYFEWSQGLPKGGRQSYGLYVINMSNGELFPVGQVLAMAGE